jgi:hypothetical protein
VIISQHESQVTLSLNIPVDLLEKLRSNRLSMRNGAAAMGAVPQPQPRAR